MKIVNLILITLLLLLSACSKKSSGSTEAVQTEMTTVSDSIADVGQSQDMSIPPERDTEFVKNLLPQFEQYLSSDNVINFTLPSSEFTLFGMNVVTNTFLPADTIGENKHYFSHYNPRLLEIIDIALDFPLIQKALGRIQSIHLLQGWSSAEFSTSRFELESDFANSLILHKLYLERYPEIFRKIKKRYEMAICKDSASEYLNTTFDLYGSFNGAYMAFWIRRSFDGTDSLFESILKKAIRIMNPAVYAAVDSIAASWGDIRADEQVVLAFDSYSDEYALSLDPSIFPGRENILCNNAFFLDSISDFERNEDVVSSVQKSAVGKMLREKSGYSLFEGSYTFYALYTKNKVPGWWQFSPEYTLTFKSLREPCDGPDLYWAVHLTIGMDKDTTVPMLITAISAESKRRPGKDVFIPQGIADSSIIPGSDTTSYTVTTTYTLPKNNRPLIKLWKVDTLAYVGGEISKRVVLKSTLIGKWSDGLEYPIYTDEGEGVYEFTDADISNIVFTDIDGDGNTDISFSGKANGKWIVLFHEGTTFEVKNIKRARPDASGGC